MLRVSYLPCTHQNTEYYVHHISLVGQSYVKNGIAFFPTAHHSFFKHGAEPAVPSEKKSKRIVTIVIILTIGKQGIQDGTRCYYTGSFFPGPFFFPGKRASAPYTAHERHIGAAIKQKRTKSKV